MKATEKQKELLTELHNCKYISDCQFQRALNSINFASKIIAFGIEVRKSQMRSFYKECYPPSLKRIKEIMRVQGVHVSDYNGKRITRW